MYRGKRFFFFIFLDEAGYFCNAKPPILLSRALPVPKCIVDPRWAIVKGDHTARWMPWLPLFIGSTHINKNIIHTGRDISLFAGAGVDGSQPNTRLYRPLSVWMVTLMDRAIKWSFPVSDHTDVTLVGDVVDKPGDFGCMTFDDDFVFFPGLITAYAIPYDVKVPLINVGLEVFQPYFSALPLKTGRRSIVGIRIKTLRFFIEKVMLLENLRKDRLLSF